MNRQTDIYKELVEKMLQKEGVFVKSFEDLSKFQKEFAQIFFEEQVFPVLTPVALDANLPFPKLLIIKGIIFLYEKNDSFLHFLRIFVQIFLDEPI